MDHEYEPMEVDLSSNSNNAMDISYNDLDFKMPDIKIKEEPCDTEHANDQKNIVENESQPHVNVVPTVIKRFLVKIPPRTEKVLFMTNTTMSVIFTLVALISLLTYQIMNFECSKELDSEAIRQTLSNNLYGQPQAIESIIGSLQAKSSSKILFFYGGTGVGKTLTISLILETLYRYANIYHYTMPSFADTISTDIMLGFNLCPSSMIVVDDLNINDMHIEKYLKKFIEKSENLGKNITIILSFNCDIINDQYVKKCDYSFYSDLVKTFNNLKAMKTYIKFNSLEEDHLRKCIEKELGSKRLSEEKLKEVAKNFNVTVDGCKGVHKKIKFLNIL